MPRSLRSRLISILLLLAIASVVSGLVMFALFRQSTAAQMGQVSVAAERACGAIARGFGSYAAERQIGALDLDSAKVRDELPGLVAEALRDRAGLEGGIWQAGKGAIAYAFPSYEGSGPKTDVPPAELPSIAKTTAATQANNRLQLSRIDTASQALLIAACPVPGPVTGLAAWTMTRVHSFGGTTYWQLMLGLVALCGSIVAACLLSGSMVLTWSRHVRRIEAALVGPDGDLPVLAETGERELDRIVAALNEAGQRGRAVRARADEMSQAVARAERLAAVGRVAAGVAHEIRSPIAAMRLKAEMALSRDQDRKDKALRVVIDQVDRLDDLVARLLAVSEPEPVRAKAVALAPFLEKCAAAHREAAAQRHSRIELSADADSAEFDSEQMARALGNLISNALEASSSDTILVSVSEAQEFATFSVSDHGPGPPDAIRDTLFDPFVTGRPEGAGLGLSFVREVAEAHGGSTGMTRSEGLTSFWIRIPCRAS